MFPVDDIEAATSFFAELLTTPGERVWKNRHYFPCGDVILACVVPEAEPSSYRSPNDPRIVYLAVDDLDACYDRAHRAGARVDGEIGTRGWGERSFYCDDPFGNRLCFVDAATVYSGGPLDRDAEAG